MERLNPWYVKPALNLYARRPFWIMISIMAFVGLMIGHHFYQRYLYLPPSEINVYIRFVLVGLVISGILGAIKPTIWWGQLMGFASSLLMTSIGLYLSVRLFFADSLLCDREAHFIFGLPLDEWFPTWFKPLEVCGVTLPVVPDHAGLTYLQEHTIKSIQHFGGWFLVPPYQFGSADTLGMIFFLVLTAILAWGLLQFLLKPWRRAKY